MSLFDMNKGYMLGVVNVVTATFLAGAMGVLLILQIKAYELNVSYSFSWRFFLYDPFASRLIGLVAVAMVINIFSAVITMSGMYSRPVETNAVMLSMASILWIVIYMSVDFAFEQYAVVPVILLILTLMVLIAQQMNRLRMKFILFFVTILVLIVPLIGRLTDDGSRENLPQRQLAQ